MFFEWVSRENFISVRGKKTDFNFVHFLLLQLNTCAVCAFSWNKNILTARMHSVESFKICALLSL
jgi:hypothetical protein